MLSPIFERFVQMSPITVMIRAIMERIFHPERLDELFEQTAQKQYTRELLFSTVVSVMSLVVCQIRPSVSAALKAFEAQIGVSRVAFYSKLNGIEPSVSQALVRYSAAALTPVVQALGGQLPELLPGYRVKVVDGNCLGVTEHRLAVLRPVEGGPLPGKSLVVLDPSLMLAIDEFPCEDAYTQERTLLDEVLLTVQPQDVWIGDRNLCTRTFIFGVARRSAYCIVRQHQQIPLTPLQDLYIVGSTATGTVFEQRVQVELDGHSLTLRRIVIRLTQPTRHGDTQVVILTNLPPTVSALQVAELYLKRWTVEGLFQVITDTLRCEINTLGYPKAALFSFAMALVAYNLLSVVKAALRAVHGTGKIEAAISNYYLVEEIQATYHGMMIAIPAPDWRPFADLCPVEFAGWLKQWAAGVNLKRFLSSPKLKKNPPPERKREPKRPHVSTARLLEQKKNKRSP
jgi:hypothetical protein